MSTEKKLIPGERIDPEIVIEPITPEQIHAIDREEFKQPVKKEGKGFDRERF